MAKHRHLYDPPMMHDRKAENDALREKLFADPHREMWLHVGHFITWYAAAEFQITMMMFTLSQSRSIEHFEILTRGLDLPAKIDRFKRAADVANTPVGPELAARLDHLRGPIGSLRNKIAHGFLMWGPNGMQISSLAAPPLTAGQKPHPNLRAPEVIPADTLFERSLWTKAFSMDLGDLQRELPQLQTLERAEYRTSLPPGTPRGTPQKARRAKSGKRGQKPR